MPGDNPWDIDKTDDLSNKDQSGKDKSKKGIHTLVRENIKETNKDHKNKELYNISNTD
jgi:hypothetical protein